MQLYSSMQLMFPLDRLTSRGSAAGGWPARPGTAARVSCHVRMPSLMSRVTSSRRLPCISWAWATPCRYHSSSLHKVSPKHRQAAVIAVDSSASQSSCQLEHVAWPGYHWRRRKYSFYLVLFHLFMNLSRLCWPAPVPGVPCDAVPSLKVSVLGMCSPPCSSTGQC
jgi:hypothetical protein